MPLFGLAQIRLGEEAEEKATLKEMYAGVRHGWG